MKTMKKIAALAMALVLALGMMSTASALGENHTITINGTEANHVYVAYQIFTGDLSGNILSNIKWGNGVDSAALLTALKDDVAFEQNGVNVFAKCLTAGEVADVLETSIKTTAQTDAFAAVVGRNLATVAGTSEETAAPYTITGLDAGYYLIMDKLGDEGTTLPEHSAYTKYIIEVVQDVDVDPKVAVPSLTKQVSKTHDKGYAEGVSANFTDTVYYKLTGTMPVNIAAYDTYYYQIVDEIPGGLTFDLDTDLLHVQAENNGTMFDIAPEQYQAAVANGKLTITFPDVVAAIEEATTNDVWTEDKIVVCYKAVVNSDAVIGEDGNWNNAVLNYSNDPNEDYTPAAGTDSAVYAFTNKPASVGTTAEASAAVYCYKLVLKKVDGDTQAPLAGAVFILYRNEGSNTYYAVVDGDGNLIEITTDESQATEMTTGADGIIEVNGLSEGVRHWVEKTAPAGYNKIVDDIYVKIEDEISLTDGTLTSFTGSVLNVGKVAYDMEEGSVTVTVENNKGATLPETGGVGTTIFYIAGGVLVLAAAVVLITKKRMGEN